MADAASDEATFVYPPKGNFSTANGNRMINTFDVLYIEYESSWDRLNLTLFCLQGTTSTTYQYLNVEGNPILGDGLYRFGDIESRKFNIPQYPSECHFKLTKFGDNAIALDGGHFFVTSDAASSTTFQPSSTSSAASTQGIGSSAPAKASAAATSSAASASSSSSASSTASGSSANSGGGGLSTGASAGIGVGVAAGVILFAVLAFILIKRRRRTPNEIAPTEKPELPADSVVKSQDMKYGPNPGGVYNHEMEGVSRAELENPQQPHAQRHELGS